MPLGLYAEGLNVVNTNEAAFLDAAEIAAGSFEAGHTYLIIANIYFETTSASNDSQIRFCHGPDGSETDFTDGNWTRDAQGGSNGNNFGGIALFTQPGTTEQVKLMIKGRVSPSDVTAHLAQLFALDVTDLTENTDYYFAEHTTDDSTMTTAFEDGASVTIVGDSSATWWVIGDVVRNTGATNVSDHTRLNLDGNTAHQYVNEGDDTTNDKNSWLFSRSYVPDSSSVAKMQYGVESGSTGTYFSSRIFAIKLSLFRQFFAEDTTTDSGSIQTNFVTLATESVTPEVTGDWFYIGGFTSVVAGVGTDTLHVRLQDDNDGSMGSDPDYGDDEPGIHAGDDTNEDGFIIFKMKSLTSGASRTVNLDARDTATASTAKNRTLVGFALELEGGGVTVTSDVTTDAAISTTNSADVTTTAAISTTVTSDVTTTASISITVTTDVTTSAALSTTNNADVTTDAATSRTEEEDVTSDASISRAEQTDVATTAAISMTVASDVTTDASIEVTGAANTDVTTSAAISTTNTSDVATSAAISITVTSDVTTSAALSRTEQSDVTADAAISRTEQADVTSDAAISQTVQSDITSTAALTRTEQGDVATSGAISRIEQASVTTDAAINVQGQAFIEIESSAAIGPPASLLIDNRTLSASWIDGRTLESSWIDGRIIKANWVDSRIIKVP